ncbi:MAG TPA: imidazole glycerol phosphate synthase subunit HisH [Fimbriimonadaceae bacterium]|nr:imidazole glycerol phosphate synthase subunit HisH [Fimbriimonadaceae bacterium]
MTVVLDYGINNLRSVEKAIQYLGHECSVQTDLSNATKLIIPGVGAFRRAMDQLAPIRDKLIRFAADGNPILGICLGQQLLFDSSEEFGETAGLGLIPGKVKLLPSDKGLKVPHMGWSKVSFRPESPLATELRREDRMFFVHSLYTDCDDATDVEAWCDYGVRFPAAVRHKNIFGVQFHPEKSGQVGLQLLRNFLLC